MESAPGMDINLDVEESVQICYEHLKSRVEFMFDTWRVAYWSVKVQRSYIMKSGIESDIARPPVGKGCNKSRQQRTKFNSEERKV